MNVPKPANEPVYSYEPGSLERTELESALEDLTVRKTEIPLIIGGKEIRTGVFGTCVEPHNHRNAIATYHKARREDVTAAIDAAAKAWKEWSIASPEDRAAVLLKAADLLAGKYRYEANAATMLNQSKNAYQAEIDSACEMIDFWRFNPYYMKLVHEIQPDYSPSGFTNTSESRALEGFVFAVTPFNFTSIAGNLPSAPALMGNTVIWKPSRNSVLSSYILMKIMQEAGMPDGVINFLPGPSAEIADILMTSEHFTGIHYTGSTAVFQGMWKKIGENIASYRSYPRIVGETGGKDFVMVHSSAEVDAVATALLRGAFEYQGQKCSAASRAYIPESIWPAIRDKLVADIATIKMGPVQDFSCFMNAVIDSASFTNCLSYINHARQADDAEILCGGGCDDSTGFFVEPTIILTTNPYYKSMEEEIFGPILTLYVYKDREYNQTLELCNKTSMYALTGSIFAADQDAVDTAFRVLRQAAGNFYINDKPTGAVVGQQPFGGSRGSGTNDKAGSMLNLLRWSSPRSIKKADKPPTDYRYPFMG